MKKIKSRYIGIAISLLLMGVIVFVLLRSYSDTVKEIEVIEAESLALQKEIKELETIIAELEAVQDEKKHMEENVAFVLDHYALKISPETSIRLIRGVENATGTTVRSIAFGTESRFFSSELVVDEEAGTLQGYRAPLVISYETSYGNFKRLLDYINDYPERMNVESVSASFNSATGYLAGSMTINLYRLEGTGREYIAPVEPELSLGVENIFGTIQ